MTFKKCTLHHARTNIPLWQVWALKCASSIFAMKRLFNQVSKIVATKWENYYKTVRMRNLIWVLHVWTCFICLIFSGQDTVTQDYIDNKILSTIKRLSNDTEILFICTAPRGMKTYCLCKQRMLWSDCASHNLFRIFTVPVPEKPTYC